VFCFRDIDPNFLKRLHRQGIERAWFEPRALGLEKITASFVKQRRRHLAARTVVDANKEHFLFHRRKVGAKIDKMISANPTWRASSVLREEEGR
jgi:hypothetical protein